MKEENKSGREELKRVAKESTVFEDALVFSFVKLVGKALEGESKVLYEEAELC